jgi:hypothetical protein
MTRFTKISFVVCVMLLPFLAYSVWDYVEMARLRRRLDAIAKSGAPAEAPYQRPTGDAAESERYYRAASALSIDFYDGLPAARNRLQKALRDGQWSADTIGMARAAVARNAEALALVDRAAARSFTGFLAGSSYNYRVADLFRLAHLCEMRAAVAIAASDGNAALASYASEARLIRALDLAPLPGLTWGGVALPSLVGLSAAVERGQSSGQARDVLARALAEVDRDDRHAMAVLQSRSAALRGPDYRGPIVTHFLVASLDVSAELLVAAQQPWPARIDAMNKVGGWPIGGFPPRSEGAKTMLRGFTRSTAEQTRRIRCARLVVSGRPLDLVDPLSGKTLEAASCHL